MRIIIDVMGGDKAPEEAVRGVMEASREINATFIMVGDKPRIEAIAKDCGADIRRFDIVHAPEVITMEDDPLTVMKAKSNSSMAIALRLLAEGKGDALVSSGNTGALFTGATLIVRKIKGVLRAGIGAMVPLTNPVLLLDTGANVTVTPDNLEQFAMLGSAYMRKMYGIEAPRVGLLNNGSEPCKGTELQQEAYKLLSANPEIRFVGNIESNTLPFDVCDVIVTDGFTGNIFLKSVEGLGKLLFGKLKDVFYENAVTKLAALSMKKQFVAMKRQFDPSEHGGAPILGISKPVIKAHGSSDAKAFKNAIRQAVAYADSGVIFDVAESAKAYSERRHALQEAEKEKHRASEALASTDVAPTHGTRQ